jgi:hypothetical protein
VTTSQDGACATGRDIGQKITIERLGSLADLEAETARRRAADPANV